MIIPRGALIVSCQAKEGEPMREAAIMAAVAQSVVAGGAAAVRANTPDHIRAIRAAVGKNVPIFGIYKRPYPDSDVYITPTLKEVEAIVEAGCDVITVEATDRPRPNNQPLEEFIAAIKREFPLPLMADVSTLAEGITAETLGADMVATTMAGYTPYSRQMSTPDFALIEELAAAVRVPIIAEGRITTPDDARRALECGAYAVCVGSMITRPSVITAYFRANMA
jgi:N-acylglucosamine-6-phosphate 2-epimerase